MFQNSSQHDLLQIIQHFSFQGTPVSAKAFGSGHINDTFLIETREKEYKDYLLQRINLEVFHDPDKLMSNIRLVTTHLLTKVIADKKHPDRKVLTLVPAIDGTWFYRSDSGQAWRMYDFIDGSKSYDVVKTTQQASEGGRAFGEFQKQLADLDAALIYEVIPYFHHIGHRLDSLKKAVGRDVFGRKAGVEAELDFIAKRENDMFTILDMAASGQLPLRIIHNDTKFNNVLLDQHDRVKCVIDLDTVMPGYVAYDFGDAIRTIINRAAEDEPNLDKITLNMPLFEAYTQGYMEKAGDFLVRAEIESLLHGVFLLPYMQAVRFLTDYLEGDIYFKTEHGAHNLQRTRAQLRLLFELEAHRSELEQIIGQVTQSQHF
ncbi:Ser/Thr protein kinase RdoA involved in Cpx stress response, MazF antagonist [bacterium A37T11]|nr:Ser/Thr protein kinase RdoA involved in Cpx stress response, MazF antagonist [bacterium A37T11]